MLEGLRGDENEPSRVALLVLRGTIPNAELCRRAGIATSLYYS